MTASPATETTAPAGGWTLTGWHVLGVVVGFFAIVIALDVWFVTLAYRTFPGQVSETPYEDGVAFNRRIARQDAQARLGWTAAAAADPLAARVELRDAGGVPLRGLEVTGRRATGPALHGDGARPLRGASPQSIRRLGPDVRRPGRWPGLRGRPEAGMALTAGEARTPSRAPEEDADAGPDLSAYLTQARRLAPRPPRQRRALRRLHRPDRGRTGRRARCGLGPAEPQHRAALGGPAAGRRPPAHPADP